MHFCFIWVGFSCIWPIYVKCHLQLFPSSHVSLVSYSPLRITQFSIVASHQVPLDSLVCLCPWGRSMNWLELVSTSTFHSAVFYLRLSTSYPLPCSPALALVRQNRSPASQPYDLDGIVLRTLASLVLQMSESVNAQLLQSHGPVPHKKSPLL